MLLLRFKKSFASKKSLVILLAISNNAPNLGQKFIIRVFADPRGQNGCVPFHNGYILPSEIASQFCDQ